MATKAAKSITINATKFELANALGVDNGKLQLKAKDVVLDEVEVASDFIIDLTDGQEMFEFTNTTWTCKAFDADDLKAAIRAGKRIVIRSKNYLDNDDPTTNTMILACTQARDSYGGNEVMTEYFDGIKYYTVLAPFTGTVTSLNVYHENTRG